MLSLTTDAGEHEPCVLRVAGTNLTITPQSSTATVITGTIALQQNVPNGGGGAGGAGGGGAETRRWAAAARELSSRLGRFGRFRQVAPACTGMRTDGPCDVYAAANMPCVAAYSMIRGLLEARVRRGAAFSGFGTAACTAAGTPAPAA